MEGGAGRLCVNVVVTQAVYQVVHGAAVIWLLCSPD